MIEYPINLILVIYYFMLCCVECHFVVKMRTLLSFVMIGARIMERLRLYLRLKFDFIPLQIRQFKHQSVKPNVLLSVLETRFRIYGFCNTVTVSSGNFCTFFNSVTLEGPLCSALRHSGFIIIMSK